MTWLETFEIFVMMTGVSLAIGSTIIYINWRAPLGFYLILPKLLSASLSPHLAILSALHMAVSLYLNLYVAATLTGLAMLGWIYYAWRVVGVGMSPKHFTLWLIGPKTPPRFYGDVEFGTVPETEKSLRCDIWQPPEDVKPSGVAVIYMHGSGWYIMSKGFRTKHLFRHLTAEGHLIMDIDYRLYPETKIPGMVGDCKRAIAWMKKHAAEYGADPDRIVLKGGSSGGHLALLTAFAPHHLHLTPPDLVGMDLSVQGVISSYGLVNLRASYYHLNQHKTMPVTDPKPDWDKPPIWPLRWIMDSFAYRYRLGRAMVAGRMDWLMGGTPETAGHHFDIYSPIYHTSSTCPPTLLLQGEHDIITPPTATREMADNLRAVGVPVTNVVLPYTEHGFDLVVPILSPTAHIVILHTKAFLNNLSANPHDPYFGP